MVDSAHSKAEFSGANEALYSVQYEKSDAPLSVTLVNALATVTDTDPTELPPLGRVFNIDFDMVDDLFCPSQTDSPPETYLRITYQDYEITVHANGIIRIYDRQ